ncbi:metallophosphoesterase [bacterium]|nr:metallophosphoesterase [bacterium]
MKILHFGDIHARDKDIDEVEQCLNHVVAVARKEQPDIIIDAGDTFDSSGIKADSLAAKLIFRIFAELADIAPVAVLIGTPSHDGKIAETLRYIKARYPVWVSAVPEMLYLVEGDLNNNLSSIYAPTQAPVDAVISMCPAPTKQHFNTFSDIKGSDAEIAVEMSKMFAGFASQVEAYPCPHILVGHWNTTGSLISETQTLTGVDIEISRDQMTLANADLICLGHIHKQQKLEPNIFYCGSIYRTNRGETEDKGFYIHEIEQIPNDNSCHLTGSRFELTPARKLLKISEDFTRAGKIDEFDTQQQPDIDEVKDSNILIEIKVFQDEAQKVDIELLKTCYLSAGAKEVTVKLIRVPRENVRSKNILKLTTLREKLIEQAALKNETVPESILLKADLLESETNENLVAEIATNNPPQKEKNKWQTIENYTKMPSAHSVMPLKST